MALRISILIVKENRMNNSILSKSPALALTKKSISEMPRVLLLMGLCSALMWPLSDAAATTSCFGPNRYTRRPGPPQTFTETFQHCGIAPCQLVVVNGNRNGTHRVTSASISLNGRQIIRPRDLNQHVARIVRPVVLEDNNQLTIRLASRPGSFFTVSVECVASPVVLSAGPPGVSLLNPTTLLSAFGILNSGTAAAENVQVTAITLPDGTLTSPTLPDNLGTIPPGSSVILNADFTGGPFTPRGTYALTVNGTYTVGNSSFFFTLHVPLIVPPAAPGSATVTSVTVESHSVSGAPFPHQPPSFDDEVNRPSWTLPTAPFVPGTPTATSTNVQTAARGRVRTPAFPVVFLANRGLGLTSATSTIPEPSGASGGGVIFVSANFTAAYSTDGGTTFTQLDPSKIFPADAVGFCCDQIVQYVPPIDRFIWLLQGNGVRIASASPADIINSGGTAWTYWNLTPDIFGQTGFDYPDLSVGNNYLYMSWNAFGGNEGHQVARTSLAGLQAGGTIGIDYTNPSDSPMASFAKLMQNTLDEIFWAGHNNNSNMRVFSLAEGSNTYFWRDIEISTFATFESISSTTPDGKDWLTMLRDDNVNFIIGATRVSNQLWFAWTAGRDSNFQQPHVEMVTLDRNNNFNVIQQVQIWNNDYAFAYPALATNPCTGEVGLSLMFGGNGNYENHVVGFWGDFIVYATTASNVGTMRSGDYVSIRQAPVTDGNGTLFTAFGYGLNSVPPEIDIRYVLFGRPANFCIP
jgi:hypothetical protein